MLLAIQVKNILFIVIGYLIIINLISFILYKNDKKKAIKHQYRTKEKTLLLSGLIGGVFGSIVAMKIYRHKTKHWYFVVLNAIYLVIYVALLAFLIYKSI